MFNALMLRTTALVVHIFLNVIVISYLVSYDPTGSWIRFAVFIAALLVLLILFVRHLVSFISFIKSN